MRETCNRTILAAALMLAVLTLTPPSASAAEFWLAGSQWGPVPVSEQTKGHYVRFSAKGKVFISGGCNHYRGTFRLDGEALEINEGMRTLKACADEVWRRERAFVHLLVSARKAVIVNHHLVLKDAGGNELVRLARQDWD